MRAVLVLIAVSASFSSAAVAQMKYSMPLTGAAEVPGPGSEKGTGSAELTVDTAKGQICYMLMSQGTDAPTMAHIHKGAPGVAGGVVVPLTAPANGMSEGCAPAAADVLAAIVAKPSDYYVNVHSAAFPKGAIRGQLAK